MESNRTEETDRLWQVQQLRAERTESSFYEGTEEFRARSHGGKQNRRVLPLSVFLRRVAWVEKKSYTPASWMTWEIRNVAEGIPECLDLFPHKVQS